VSSSKKPQKKATRPPASKAEKRSAPQGRNLSAQPKPAIQAKTVKPIPPASRQGIRLAGSASSRLTIKPSPAQGPRPQLELSTKTRPSGPRPLSEVELDEDEVLIDGFDAILDGETVRITAVLERTCVYLDRMGDRKLARKEYLVVEADLLPIRRRSIG
jgi:hypothetical protein